MRIAAIDFIVDAEKEEQSPQSPDLGYDDEGIGGGGEGEGNGNGKEGSVGGRGGEIRERNLHDGKKKGREQREEEGKEEKAWWNFRFRKVKKELDEGQRRERTSGAVDQAGARR